jgi:ABC-type transport system involved in multi-copper enzyme maturation permease subunit
MSATTSLDSATSVTTGDDRRPGFGRLTVVELRKMVDTRSGFWLPLVIAAITLIVVIVSALVHGSHDATVRHLFDNAVQPGSFLLPILGILLVCGEWTQRTTLATFTLVPNRGRVLAAKLAASVVLAVAACIVCLVFALIFGEALGSNAPGGAGGISGVVLLQGLLYLAASMVIGVGFGAAILVSAPGIVAYLLLPTVWGALASSINALATLDHWLDIGTTMSPLSRHALSATQWAHVATTLALWMAVPLIIGWWRFRHRDVN